ncbi:MAG: orotidine-5'-phosphate decarboxylase, partial [Chitinophagaceae bacterium]|nr:orotidine-5'-phosphate decarboxylase [Chitinophagaceae bacterium]
MTKLTLVEEIIKKQSYLCVGLDADCEKLPKGFSKDAKGVLAFNKAIIDATAAHCVSYKINTAFYESMGVKGWQAMEETLAHIPDSHFTIADAKRGDIGNTSAHYAKTFFEVLPFDAITV